MRPSRIYLCGRSAKDCEKNIVSVTQPTSRVEEEEIFESLPSDAGSKMHLSPTDLSPLLPAQEVKLEQFVNNCFGETEAGLGFPRS